MKLLTMNKLNNRQNGMSLIEVLIAMLIGIMMLTGAVTMFVTNKRVYTEQNEMGALQENARFAMGLLVKDIRLASFVGCSDNVEDVSNLLNSVTVTAITSFTETSTSALIEGSENGANWQPSNSTDAVANMITTTDGVASDGITLRYIQPTSVSLTAAMSNVSDDLTVAVGNGFTQGSFVVVGDCGGADIFQVTNTDANATGTIKHAASGTPGNSSANLSRVYDTDAVMYRLGNYRYYIQNSGNGTGPALWRTTPGGSEELIEGVESMQLLYGEDTSANGTANTFVDASAVTNWVNVVSVKIALLMRTVKEYGETTDTNTYSLLGTVVDPVDDRRRRRIFTATVEIRNRRS